VVYATVLRFLVLANSCFLIAMVALSQPLADLLRHPERPELIWWMWRSKID
jgi:hypothetical protein